MSKPKRKVTKSEVSEHPTSMTGFGKSSCRLGKNEFVIEIKTVNHRGFDPIFRIPREFSVLESEFRSTINERVKRGRIEVTVVPIENPSKADGIEIDRERIARHLKAYTSICSEFGIPTTGAGELIARLVLSGGSPVQEQPAVLSPAEIKSLVGAVTMACDDLVKMREVEGLRLVSFIKAFLKELQGVAKEIERFAIAAPKEIKKRITERTEGLVSDKQLDKARLATEIAFIADRADVSEELHRLESHFSQVEAALKIRHQGRRLDFLVQECLREFNTIGSKIQNSKSQERVVTAKVILEKMREQIQNIE